MDKLVSLEYLNDYDIENLRKAIKTGLDRLNLNNVFKANMKVLVKACLPKPVSQDLAESTHPAVVRALVDCLSEMGVKCVITDCPEKKFNENYLNTVYLNTGMLEMANQTNCELNLNLKSKKVEINDGVKTKAVRMLEVIKDVDAIINVGKLKFDDNLGYLGATSNMFSVIPGGVQELIYNRLVDLGDFNNYIIDIYETLKNKITLNILDGVVALEEQKTQRMLNCLAMSESAYAIDAVIFDIFKINYSNTILKQAENRNLFSFDKPYKLVGCKLEKFNTEGFVFTQFDNHTEIKHNNTYFKSHQRRVVIDKKVCKGCKICSKICPTNAILMKYDNNGELYAEIDYKKCIFCKKCLTACPYKVVQLKTPYGYKKIMKEVNKNNKQ